MPRGPARTGTGVVILWHSYSKPHEGLQILEALSYIWFLDGRGPGTFSLTKLYV